MNLCYALFFLQECFPSSLLCFPFVHSCFRERHGGSSTRFAIKQHNVTQNQLCCTRNPHPVIPSFTPLLDDNGYVLFVLKSTTSRPCTASNRPRIDTRPSAWTVINTDPLSYTTSRRLPRYDTPINLISRTSTGSWGLKNMPLDRKRMPGYPNTTDCRNPPGKDGTAPSARVGSGGDS